MTIRYRDGFALASLAWRRRGGLFALRISVDDVPFERLTSVGGDHRFLLSADGSPLYGRIP